jgi:two-component system, NtrC family, sensor kinase
MIDLEILPAAALPAALECNLRRIANPVKASAHFLSALRLRFAADAAWLHPGADAGVGAREALIDGDASLLDERLVLRFVAGEYPEHPDSVLLAPLKVHGRLRGVLGVARALDFPLGSGRDLNKLARILGSDLARREEERLARVLDRIKEKVVAEIRSRDLAYQILDGLYELVEYDHSAALLIHDDDLGVFRIEAEKIVWTKAKSAFIGHKIAATPEMLARLPASERLLVLARDEGESGPDDALLAPLVDYAVGRGIPDSRSVLLAPLFFERHFLGVLKIASQDRASFSEHDRTIVERFLPAAAIALRNLRVRLSLENQAVQAEMRAGLVTLARAVAHDVNNAIGAMLPLAEQLQEDVRHGAVDRETAARDLDTIVEKAKLCKRIFSNMLQLAVERRGEGPVDLNRVLRDMAPMLEAIVAPRRIRLRFELADFLAPIEFSKDHLERVVWNLVTNSVEAIAVGEGTIAIATGEAGGRGSWLEVRDDGCGIEPSLLSKVDEPFFTTKPGGTGLGLSLCRSIAWQHGGTLEIRSVVGEGTTVRLQFAGGRS